MRHVDRGEGRLPLDPSQLTAQLLAQPAVQGAERFVEEEEPGVEDDGAGEGDALLLAPAELLGVPAAQLLQLDQLEHVVDQLLQPGALDAPQLEREGQVLRHREVGEQGVVLEDEADVALAGRQLGDVLGVDLHAARRRVDQPGDDAQERRLPRAAGAEEGEELSWLHVERDALERLEALVAMPQGDAGDAAGRPVADGGHGAVAVHRAGRLGCRSSTGPGLLALRDTSCGHDSNRPTAFSRRGSSAVDRPASPAASNHRPSALVTRPPIHRSGSRG